MRLVAAVLALVLSACASPQKNQEEPESSEAQMALGPSVARTQRFSYLMDWPVDEARLTQRFHLSGRRPHYGVDLAAPRGSRIVSAHKGRVIYTGHGFHGYGRLVIVEQSLNLATFYSHLDQILVKQGQVIEQGHLLGLMGKSGNARGVHLHFEIRKDRQPVDPLLYLPNGHNI